MRSEMKPKATAHVFVESHRGRSSVVPEIGTLGEKADGDRLVTPPMLMLCR